MALLDEGSQLCVEVSHVVGRDGCGEGVGAIVGNIANPFSAEILGGMEEVLADRGYAVLSTSHDDDASREQRLARDFLRRRVDGIVLSAVAGSQAYLGAELDRGYPIVFVDRTPTDVRADAVVGDNEGGADRATRHLIDHGHQRIAVLCDATVIETARLRMAGHERALAAHGIPLRPEYVVRDVTSIEQARVDVARLLALPDPPTALFTAQIIVRPTPLIVRGSGEIPPRN